MKYIKNILRNEDSMEGILRNEDSMEGMGFEPLTAVHGIIPDC
jgi:hypothetical protein